MAKPVPEHLILWRAAVASPEDDAPWGAYADWLRERGRDEEADQVPVLRSFVQASRAMQFAAAHMATAFKQVANAMAGAVGPFVESLAALAPAGGRGPGEAGPDDRKPFRPEGVA
jgi:uncharacterized protein (TIGR02996 family)